MATAQRSRLGAHVSAKGGLVAIPDKAVEIGCESVQIFASSPQMWRPPNHAANVATTFRERCAELGLGPVALHAIYLVNPASEDPELRAKSATSLVVTLNAADALGAELVVTHLGSDKGADRAEAVGRAIGVFVEVLEAYTGKAKLLLETCAGPGGTLGATFAELGGMMHALGDPTRVGACLDTAHIFGAGYDIRDADGLKRTMAEWDAEIGFDRLWAVHLNDSKAPLGSNKDRHENLGDGLIGFEALSRFVQHSGVIGTPIYLEVPGYSQSGPDRPSLERLYQAAGRTLG
jgi:deoxyribonuclease-4